MFLNKKITILFFLMLLSRLSFAQENNEQQATVYNELEEVVVTGQYNRQSIKKSVHNVIVINREEIENQAAINLADLLNFKLNLTIIPNSKTGKSTISLFGLDSQYFNILIDNVPLVSDTGFGNNIDLTQVNLDYVERIEIVEGAMGVEYGANSVSGVINIITKKSSRNRWNINTFLQEETVSNEYAFFNKGKHIQNLSVSHNISDKWFARVGVNRSDFAGFFDGKKGRDYYKNDKLRGYSWLPKDQINTNGFVNYNNNNLNISFRRNYFNEQINYYNPSVRANIDTQAQTSNPSATDKVFTTNRFVNTLNVNGNLPAGSAYSLSASYQSQKRRLNEFNYYILTQEKTNQINEVYQSSEVFFSKGSISNFINSKNHNFQTGYEVRYNSGFDTQASGDVTQQDKTRNQTNLALFASSELNISDALMIRPGVRYEYNTLFKSKILSSLNARYLLNNGFELRGNIGTSYRTPNFQELYYYMVDSNHDIRGNLNLNPEEGYFTSLSLNKRSWFDTKNTSLFNSLKVNYLSVDDKIDLAIVNSSPLKYQYINIDSYKMWGLTTTNTLKSTNWVFNAGANVQGIAQIANNEKNAKNDYLYSFQFNSSVSYNIQNWQTVVTMLLKHNGKEQNYLANGIDANGNSTFIKSTTDAYNWLEASVKKSFFKNKLVTTLGARNLFDVTNVAISNASTGGTHPTNNNSLLLGYGRSFYLKLLYNINF